MNVKKPNPILSWATIFLMTVQVSGNTERVVDAIIGSATISLIYLGLSVLFAHLTISWFKGSIQNAKNTPIICFSFVVATLLDFIPIFLFVQLCIFFISILLYHERENDVSLILAIYLGAFFPVIGKTMDIVDLLGFDYIFLATLVGLGFISILLVCVVIQQGNHFAIKNNDESGNKIIVPLWKRISSPVLPINLNTTLLFTIMSITLIITANLMYDIIIGTILFWMLLGGMIFNIEIVKLIRSRDPPSRKKTLLVNIALICIDLLVSYLISVILDLLEISILFPVLLAFVFLAILNAMYLPSIYVKIREK